MTSYHVLPSGGASKRSLNLAVLQGPTVIEATLETSAELASVWAHPERMARVSYLTSMIPLTYLFLRGNFALRSTKSGLGGPLHWRSFVRTAHLSYDSNTEFHPLIHEGLEGIAWMLCAVGGSIYEGCLSAVVNELNRDGYIGSNYSSDVVSLSISMALEHIGHILSHNGTDSTHPLYRVEFNTRPLSPEATAGLVKKIFVDRLLESLDRDVLAEVHTKYIMIMNRYGLPITWDGVMSDDPRIAALQKVAASAGSPTAAAAGTAKKPKKEVFCNKDLYHFLKMKAADGSLLEACPLASGNCQYLHASTGPFATMSKSKKIASAQERCPAHVLKKVLPVLNALP